MMVLVTGSTGLLGSYLLLDLAKSGQKVRALKRPTSDTQAVHKVFGWYSTEAQSLLEKIEWIDGDILKCDALSAAMEGVDEVYHAAGMVSFDPSERPIVLKTNIQGTANVVKACLKKGVRKLCHVSSVAALGDMGEAELIAENTKNDNLRSFTTYGISKRNGELEVWRGIRMGLNAVIVNPSVILGAGNWTRGAGSILPVIHRGMRYYTGGVTGYVDVRDVCKTMLLLMKSGISGERFIVSSENWHFKDVFHYIADRLGKKRPSIRAGRILMQLAWRAEYLRSSMLRTRPSITKESATVTSGKQYFSNDKIKQAIGIEFIGIQETLNQMCDLFLRDVRAGETSLSNLT